MSVTRGRFSVKMPMGCGRNRIGSHIQGTVLTPYGLAFSRNGVEHGQLIWPGHPSRSERFRQFPCAHAGGIDAVDGKEPKDCIIAVPLYDTGNSQFAAKGQLMLVRDGVYYPYPLRRKPYAAGIVRRDRNRLLVALVSAPDGSRIDWHEVYEQDGKFGQCRYIGATLGLPEEQRPHNNICLQKQGDKIVLYAMRAYTGLNNLFNLGRGRVTQYTVTLGKYTAQLCETDHWIVQNNALLRLGPSCRFGSTIAAYGTQGGVEFDLIRTARNIRNDRLTCRRDRLYFDWGQ